MSDKHKTRILVLDANQRSALAVTRSLGKIPRLEVVTADAATVSLAGCSKYSREYRCCPSSEKQPEEFLSWLEQTIAQHKIFAIFPVTEITSQLLLMNPNRLGSCRLPFADYQTVMSLADKGNLLASAQAANIPVPDYRLFSAATDVNVEEIASFPAVVKPCLSRVWTGEHWINTQVQVVSTREELSEVLTHTPYLQHFPFMIQAFIPGHGAGIFALYDRGRPLAYFSHRRVREKPPRGGVSVVSQSAPVDTQLQQYAEALLAAVKWHGVAMVEFRISDEGLPYLMEVNTRFWGSLQLAIDAGVDFPRLLWEITANDDSPSADALGHERGTNNSVQTAKQAASPLAAYSPGQRLRWLLGDLDSLYLTLRDRDFSAGTKLLRILAFMKPVFGTRHEVNRWGDLGPAWFELKHYVKSLIGKQDSRQSPVASRQTREERQQ